MVSVISLKLGDKLMQTDYLQTKIPFFPVLVSLPWEIRNNTSLAEISTGMTIPP